MRFRRSCILSTAALLVFSFAAIAADGGSYSGYTPYSVFGIGDLFPKGTAYSRTMGGSGIASRDHRYINILNPAAVTARDTLAFMSDFSVFESNKILRQDGRTSANNLFNVGDFALSFPLFYTRPADASMMVGIRPYSSVGYSYGYYETNPGTLSSVGNVAHSYTGNGGLYQAFGAVGVEFFDELSLGVQADYYFGNIKRDYTMSVSDKAALGRSNSTEISIHSLGVRFGLQYEHRFSDRVLVGVGAVYSLDTRLHGYIDRTATSGENTTTTTDTLGVNTAPVSLASEAGIGVSVQIGNKFRANLDYTRSDWSGSGFDKVAAFAVSSQGGSFGTGVSQTLRAGVEYIPNPGDIRYYHRLIAYRAGLWYGNEYFSYSGHEIRSAGISIGATLPVFRWNNGLTVGLDMGRRGSLKDSMIRETYIGFSLGINLFDIWFQQPKYE